MVSSSNPSPAGDRSQDHDPNHPPDLAITPSWSKWGRSSLRGDVSSQRSSSKDAARGEQAKAEAEWEKDSVEDIAKWGIAGRIWEAAYLFRRYLHPRSNSSLDLDQERPEVQFDPPCPIFASGKRENEQVERSALHILELGSGVGYIGLACATELQRWARCQEEGSGRSGDSFRHVVVLTDLENVCDLLERNASAAGFGRGGTGADEDVKVLVRPLPWGSTQHASSILAELTSLRSRKLCEPTSQQIRPLDYILCSDLVYFPSLLPPLLRSLIQLTTPATVTIHSPPKIILAYKVRSLSKEEPFWAVLGVWFEIQIVSSRRRRLFQRQSSEKEEGKQEDWGQWHRFGSLQSDWHSDAEEEALQSQEQDGGTDRLRQWEEVQVEDFYLLLIATRKPSTFGFGPPSPRMPETSSEGAGGGESERDLMGGYMVPLDGSGRGRGRGQVEGQGQGQEGGMVRGQGGSDWLEWAMMMSTCIE